MLHPERHAVAGGSMRSSLPLQHKTRAASTHAAITKQQELAQLAARFDVLKQCLYYPLCGRDLCVKMSEKVANAAGIKYRPWRSGGAGMVEMKEAIERELDAPSPPLHAIRADIAAMEREWLYPLYLRQLRALAAERLHKLADGPPYHPCYKDSLTAENAAMAGVPDPPPHVPLAASAGAERRRPRRCSADVEGTAEGGDDWEQHEEDDQKSGEVEEGGGESGGARVSDRLVLSAWPDNVSELPESDLHYMYMVVNYHGDSDDPLAIAPLAPMSRMQDQAQAVQSVSCLDADRRASLARLFNFVYERPLDEVSEGGPDLAAAQAGSGEEGGSCP